jgi:hypothetical protein
LVDVFSYFQLLREDPAVDPQREFKPDFSTWAKQDRTELQEHAATASPSDVPESEAKKESDTAETAASEAPAAQAAPAADPFDATVVGPWMDLWNLERDSRLRPNKHIAKYLATDSATRAPEKYIAKGQW